MVQQKTIEDILKCLRKEKEIIKDFQGLPFEIVSSISSILEVNPYFGKNWVSKTGDICELYMWHKNEELVKLSYHLGVLGEKSLDSRDYVCLSTAFKTANGGKCTFEQTIYLDENKDNIICANY